jgi:hypothetical protein
MVRFQRDGFHDGRDEKKLQQFQETELYPEQNHGLSANFSGEYGAVGISGFCDTG